jgi:DnaJ-class molecular chaperone
MKNFLPSEDAKEGQIHSKGIKVMLTHFLTLDIPPGSSDEIIREAYIRLIKKHPPEKDPEVFQKINNAYEAIKDKRSRARTRIFFPATVVDHEQSLLAFAGSQRINRKRAGLSELINTCRTI